MASSRLLLSIVLFARGIIGYPNSPGSCLGNVAAVGGSHLETTFNDFPRAFGLIQGSLAEGEIVVTVGGSVLDDASTTYTLTTGVDHSISIVGTLYDGYKGLLVRLESVTGELDLTAALQPGLNTVVAWICEPPVVGISHSENSYKKESSGTVRLDETGDVYLDITMVGINDNIASVYGHTRFLLSFVAAARAPESEIPSDAPSSIPSDSPSILPSYDPSTAPVFQ